MSTAKMTRMGQVRHVVPSAVKETERILNNYAERMEKLFTSKTAPVKYDDPKPKQLTKEQEFAYEASEQYSVRANILEMGVAQMLHSNGGISATVVCVSVLQDAVRLRQQARDIVRDANEGVTE